MLLPLGTAGWMPAGGQQTMSAAIRLDGQLLIVDLGTGVSRLGSPAGAELLRRSADEEITILLSHFHVDHLVGLTYLPGLLEGRRVSIWGPGAALYGESTRNILRRLASPPFFSLPLENFPMNLHIGELIAGPQQIGPWRIDAMPLRHEDPVFGFRIDDAVCYLSDTECLPDAAAFARGCRLLCHEVWWPAGTSAAGTGHSEVTEVARLAKKSGVRRLALVHHNPRHDENVKADLLRAAREIFPDTILLEDMVPVPLDSSA